MFSHFFSEAPFEILQHILEELTVDDLIKTEGLAKHFSWVKSDDHLWYQLIKKKFDIEVGKSHCKIKYIIFHLFNRGIFYCQSRRDAGKNRAQEYFAKVKILIDQIEFIDETDLIWKNYILGNMYCRGIADQVDATRGIELLEAAANNKHSDAALLLAAIYFGREIDFIFNDRDLSLTAPELAQFANLPRDQLCLPSDPIKANQWLDKAYEIDGSTSFSYRILIYYRLLGFSYTHLNIVEDKQRRDQLLSLAVSQHNRHAVRILALRMIQHQASLSDGIAHLEKAVELGCATTAFELAEYRIKGILNNTPHARSTPDLTRGISLMEFAARSHCGKAAYYLGCYHRDGRHVFMTDHVNELVEVKSDINLAIKWFKHGADSFDLENAKKCSLALAKIYQRSNLTEAMKWLNHGALIGSIDCLVELGRIYLNGSSIFNVARDIERAEVYFEQAYAVNVELSIKRILLSYIESPAYQIDRFYHLQQYTKWNIRGLFDCSRTCLDNLISLFDPILQTESKPKDLHLDRIDIKEKLTTLKSLSWMDEGSFHHEVRNHILELARQCYSALGLTELDDSYLVSDKEDNLPQSLTSHMSGYSL